jgi:hypothetical protein
MPGAARASCDEAFDPRHDPPAGRDQRLIMVPARFVMPNRRSTLLHGRPLADDEPSPRMSV